MTSMNSKRSRIAFNDLSVVVQDHRTEIDAAIDSVLKSGHYILGPQVEAFEYEFARYCGLSCNGVGVANGTDALELALRALDIGPGHEVITVANAGVPTTTAIRATGARPVFVDVTPAGLMNPALVPNAITSATRCIVPVHLYGQVADMFALHRIATDNNLYIVEDAAQAAGTIIDGRWGKYSNAVCFSFYPTKNLGALGDGGMVLANDEAILQRVRSLRFYGIPNRATGLQQEFGRNSRLDEMQAAILRVRLKYLDLYNGTRRQLAQIYHAHLNPAFLHRPQDDAQNYHLFTTRVQNREELQRQLNQDDIETAVHYRIPQHSQGIDRTFDVIPNTESLCREVVSLPLWPGLGWDDVKYIAQQVNVFGRPCEDPLR